MSLAFLTRPVVAASSDSCVSCHQTLEGIGYLEHNYKDWHESVHAKSGIGCESCHGGNPAEEEKTSAHAGVKPSTHPDSLVYFTRIPSTCGTCHQAEYQAFQKSAHYKELRRTGRGPNCVTCHGSMANHILAPRDMEMSCTLCHQKPTQAAATMIALNNADVSLQRLDRALADGWSRHLDLSAQKRESQTLHGLHHHTLEQWHTFDMAHVLSTSQEITRRASTALNEIRLKNQQK